MRWWWVRHGPTHEKALVGWRDVPADLSDRAAVDRLAAALPGDALVVSSDLRRAAATADAIQGTRRRLADAAALREFDFGAWDGLGFEAAAARDPDLARAFWEQPGDIAPPGGESWNAVAARVNGFVEALSRDTGGRDVVAVAHLGVIMTQLGRALGSARAAIGQRIEPLSLTCLRRDEAGGWVVDCVNRQP